MSLMSGKMLQKTTTSNKPSLAIHHVPQNKRANTQTPITRKPSPSPYLHPHPPEPTPSHPPPAQPLQQDQRPPSPPPPLQQQETASCYPPAPAAAAVAAAAAAHPCPCAGGAPPPPRAPAPGPPAPAAVRRLLLRTGIPIQQRRCARNSTDSRRRWSLVCRSRFPPHPPRLLRSQGLV